MSDFPQTWPDDFDVRADAVFQDQIKPFIENQMKLMEIYDRKRLAVNPDIKYIFHEHAERVANDTRNTCAKLGLPDNVQENMYWAMLVHDIGKRVLPIEIWDSPEKPTGDVMKYRRSHVDLGLNIVREELGDLQHPFFDLMTDIMVNHHEKIDGTGEHGLKGHELSAPVRLACIIESYDGYTIPRPHFGDRDISPTAVLDKMRSEPGKGAAMFDMDLFEAFAAVKVEQSGGKPPTPHKPATNPAHAGKI
ncbi:HD-GYP domain-containing protein [Micavibrio aeruginosavorus]|uniref:HD-GYP domain-containing protein n=1 Tax=Micavibrio aeruginosavorus TaxID=349221 RepID=UPI003F4ADDE7